MTVTVRGMPNDFDNMTARQRLEITQYVLAQIEVNVKHESVEYVGSRSFTSRKISECFTDRTLKLHIEGEAGRSWADSQINDLNLINPIGEEWHAYDNNYGTDQEKLFIRYLSDQVESLRQRYDDFYLLRNEKAVKLFCFKTGQGFEPDFILFLRKKGVGIGNVLQLFIEPKGKHLAVSDAWKEAFLEKIQWREKIKTIFQGNEYCVYGASCKTIFRD